MSPQQPEKLQLGGTSLEYGDKTLLDQFRSATRPLPVSGAPAPKRGPGRPAGQPAQAPAAGQAGGGQLLPEAVSLMSRAAQAHRAYMRLAAAAQRPDAGPWTQFYARLALQQFEKAAMDARNNSPWFE